MGTLLYAISTATAFIVEGEVGNMLRRRKTEKKIALLEGHFILCGLSHIGIYAFSEIRKSQRPIVIINREQKAIDALALTPGDDLLYIIGDASADSVLEQAGIRRASGLISAFEDDMANIYVTLTARNLNPKIRIISRAWDASAQAKLLQAGADSTISTDRIGGQRMVSQMLHPAAVTFLDRMLARQDEVLRIENVEIVRHAAIEGRTLGEARIRERFDLLAMAVRDATSREFLFNPSLDYVLKARDVLIVMGETTRISRLREAGSQRARGVLGALETKTILKRVVKSAGGE
jgi:voltage-gated potassium channel